MKAIVLAAGRGTRLRPLTTHRPKHLLEIGGKPILLRILQQLVESSIVDEIAIVVNYEKNQIQTKVQSWFENMSKISFVLQEVTNGTGDAVDTALRQLDISDDFAVINGDVLFVEPLENFLKAAEGRALVVGTEVEDPSAFGVLDHQELELKGITEKPEHVASDALINAGFYIFPGKCRHLFSEITLSTRGEREITDVLDHLINAGESIEVFPTTKEWFDIGKPWQVLNANESFMKLEEDQYEILADIEPNVHISGNVHIAKTARIRSGVYIEGPVYIDEGADIGPNCYLRGSSYLGRDTRVGNACEIKNSVIYEDSHAAHLSYVGDSIIGRSCNLGAGTITANLRHDGQDIKLTVKGDRVTTGRRKLGVVMGDFVKTGIGVDILPGVKISAKKWINAGVVISRDQ